MYRMCCMYVCVVCMYALYVCMYVSMYVCLLCMYACVYVCVAVSAAGGACSNESDVLDHVIQHRNDVPSVLSSQAIERIGEQQQIDRAKQRPSQCNIYSGAA